MLIEGENGGNILDEAELKDPYNLETQLIKSWILLRYDEVLECAGYVTSLVNSAEYADSIIDVETLMTSSQLLLDAIVMNTDELFDAEVDKVLYILSLLPIVKWRIKELYRYKKITSARKLRDSFLGMIQKLTLEAHKWWWWVNDSFEAILDQEYETLMALSKTQKNS